MNTSEMKLIEEKLERELNSQQQKILHDVLMELVERDKESSGCLLEKFIEAKRVEGCSEKTVKYYESTIKNAITSIGKNASEITTEDLRRYLDNYQQNNNVSRVTIDNVRRILSSFYSWLEDEDYIGKSPVRRIHKVKVRKSVKETYSDEELEIMRDNAECKRDIAILDILASTGIRVGELVNLNRDDVDFEKRECIVLGKGNKQRVVYFDARTKIHLSAYLNEREDKNAALFVSMQKPYKRLEISGVEIRLRDLGRKLDMGRVHPHKFRRTLATMAIDKGMPIEQVQQLLGHQSVDTTLQYAMVNQNNVKMSHRRYIG